MRPGGQGANPPGMARRLVAGAHRRAPSPAQPHPRRLLGRRRQDVLPARPGERPPPARVVAPAVAVAPDGAVHVAYYDLEDDARDYQGLEGPVWEGRWSLVTSSSRDGGRRFDHHGVVDAALVPPERVMLIFTMPPPRPRGRTERRAARVVVGREERGLGRLRARSPDGGASWGEPVRLNDDLIGNGRHQYLPRLSLAPDGRLDAVFYDRRDRPRQCREPRLLHPTSWPPGQTPASRATATPTRTSSPPPSSSPPPRRPPVVARVSPPAPPGGRRRLQHDVLMREYRSSTTPWPRPVASCSRCATQGPSTTS
jgi:hypothetical protein